ncbi:Tfp pilus assembly major pilin PilA [Paeniclostridium ghonii]|uniref:Tfp pilus assembly major pilin PilA n=2 Tax=Paraclostridium ghonii TaxID=29358 RepID=A0ABU0MX31_9FIRM|nr:Tfp pilus assembly major pilin PilA [Paeniclostridium ghonii]
MDSFFETSMQVGGLADTMRDMIDALIASIITIPIYEIYYKKYK